MESRQLAFERRSNRGYLDKPVLDRIRTGNTEQMMATGESNSEIRGHTRSTHSAAPSPRSRPTTASTRDVLPRVHTAQTVTAATFVGMPSAYVFRGRVDRSRLHAVTGIVRWQPFGRAR